MNRIFEPIAKELFEVESTLRAEFESCPVDRIREIGAHILSAGGKRIRPALAILCAKALGCEARELIVVAASLEMLHTASLMHDDVIDVGMTRRGLPTANALWGNTLAVLVGDFMYTRAFEMLAQTGRLDVLEPSTHASNILSQGEVLQLDRDDDDYSEAHYFAVIERKTTVLFEAAAKMVCALAGESETAVNGFTRYAKALGNAFQITDDVIDYVSQTQVSGKKVGADFSEGKVTIPVIFAIENANPETQLIIKEALRQKTMSFEAFRDLIEREGGFQSCRERIASELSQAQAALAFLAPSIFKTSLLELLTFVSERKS